MWVRRDGREGEREGGISFPLRLHSRLCRRSRPAHKAGPGSSSGLFTRCQATDLWNSGLRRRTRTQKIHPATCWQAGRSSRSGSPRIRTLGKAAAGRSNDLFDPTVSFSDHTHTSRGHRRGQVLVSLRSTQGRPLRMMSSHPVLQRV